MTLHKPDGKDAIHSHTGQGKEQFRKMERFN